MMSHPAWHAPVMTPEQDAIRVAASQHGLLSRTHALRLGISERQLQWLLERARWQPVRPGVYAVGGVPVTKHMTLLAACLAAGSEALASHRAAAWTWRYDPFDSCPLEILVEHKRGPVLPDVIVHHTQRFDPVDRTVHCGI